MTAILGAAAPVAGRMRVPSAAKVRFSQLTRPEKAAIIIAALGKERAEPILSLMSEDDMRVFARATARLGEISNGVLERVIAEFVKALDEQRVAMTPDRLKELLSGVLSEDAIERIIEDMDDSDGRSVWDKLSGSDPIDLANFLGREHPQTAAVVMSRLKPEAAARVMARLEQEFAEEVVLRLAKVSQLSAAVMDAVKDSIENEFLRSARLKKSKRKPDEMIGAIFNFMPQESRDTLMEGIEEKSPDLAAAVQRKMFTFTDIPARVDPSNVGQILREVDATELIKALSAAKKNAPETLEFILSSLSRRLGDQYREQLEDAPKPTAREGEDAQFAVVGVIRKLSERGEIVLNAPDEEED
ncbi:MAG: FliG C-terminal domain-containing protein [Pseudomonadota bacterium]